MARTFSRNLWCNKDPYLFPAVVISQQKWMIKRFISFVYFRYLRKLSEMVADYGKTAAIGVATIMVILDFPFLCSYWLTDLHL